MAITQVTTRDARKANDAEYVYNVTSAKGANIKNVDNDTILLSGNASDYVVKATASGVLITKPSDKQFKLNVTLQKANEKKGVEAGELKLVFANGSVDLKRDGKDIKLEDGTALSKQAKAPTDLATKLDASETYSAVVEANTPPTGPTPPAQGSTFTLTTGADTFFGEAGKNNVITAAAGTLNANDIIIDQSATDNDVLNVTVQATQLNAGVPAAVVRGIESINVNIDAITGNVVSYDAENTTGATITLSSSRLGFNGVAGVEDAGANNVTAGANVTNLTVTGLTTGVVNTGAATTAAVTTAAATDEANVTVNGNIALTVDTATDVTIKGTANSVVTLEGNALADVAVSGPVTLSVAEDLANGLDVTGAQLVRVTGDALGTVDLSGIAAPIAIVDAQSGDSFNVASGASVALLANNTGAVTFTSATANGTVNVSTAVSQTNLIAHTNVSTFNLSVTDEVTIGTLNAGNRTLNINVADDLTITNLLVTGDVAITGSGNVVITSETSASSIDVSGLAGNLTVETSGQEVTIIGGSGKLNVDLDQLESGGQNVATTAVVIAGSGGSSVNVTELRTGTVILQGGAGTDSLVVDDGADLSGVTLTLSSVEGIVLGDETTPGAVEVTFSAAQLSGQSFSVTNASVAGLTTVNVDAVAATTAINLGGLSLTNIDSFVIDATVANSAVAITGTSTADTITVSANGSTINAGAGNDIITGGAGVDIINAGAGDDIIHGSAGADRITLGAGNDVVAYDDATQSLTDVSAAGLRASLDVITDWAAGGTNQIDLSALGLVAADFVAQADAQAVVNAFVTANANATLADVFGAIDTNVATNGALTVFQFGGNTYVYADLDDTDGAGLTDGDFAIELTGQQSLIAANFVLAAAVN